MNYAIQKMLKDLEDGLDHLHIQYFYYGIPYAVSDDILRNGALFVIPRSETIIPASTGLVDQAESEIDITLALQDRPRFYKNAQVDSGLELLNRLMSGVDECGNLLTDTVQYIIRSNIREYGVRQSRVRVVYDDKRIAKEDVITATMTLTHERLHSQQIN
jgi:hypothetical protein